VLTLALICVFSFIAGMIDSIVGGGGLLQLPALLVLVPGVPIPTILGTNKFASCAGTSMAAWRFGRHVQMDWSIIGPSAFIAFIFSYLGSNCVSLLNPGLLRPVIVVLLVGAGAYIVLMNTTGLVHAPKHAPAKTRWIALICGAGLGFYDGFFGPGTGSFLIFVFVGILGFDFLSASASAKAINVGTNLASVIFFSLSGRIRYDLALPMAVCNVLGSLVGSRLAILKGSRFIRVFFLCIIVVLIVKLTADFFRS
jgi:uncharacterized membrane protein YfcA